jgi:phage gpG-like protein
MAIHISIKPDKSFEAVMQKFRSAPEIILPFMREASTASAFMVEREAKPITPVDTGRLRASIATSLGVANKGLSSVVQTNVNYAHIVHEGLGYGRNSKARPFMEQGAEAAKPSIENEYERQISRALKLLAA